MATVRETLIAELEKLPRHWHTCSSFHPFDETADNGDLVKWKDVRKLIKRLQEAK